MTCLKLSMFVALVEDLEQGDSAPPASSRTVLARALAERICRFPWNSHGERELAQQLVFRLEELQSAV